MKYLLFIFISLMTVAQEPDNYQEFKTALGITNALYGLINQSYVRVNNVPNFDNDTKGFVLQCNPCSNRTDQGLVSYFEEEHLTQLWTPFGELMLLWNTRQDSAWKPINEKLLERVTLANDSFDLVSTAHSVVTYDTKPLPQPKHRFYGKSGNAREKLEACKKYYKEHGGTVVQVDKQSIRDTRAKTTMLD